VLDIKIVSLGTNDYNEGKLCNELKKDNVIYIQENYYFNITEISKMKNLKYLSISNYDHNNYRNYLSLYHNYSYTNVFDINTISHLPLETIILESVYFSLDGIEKIVTLKKLIINIRHECRPDIFEIISKIPNIECIIKNWQRAYDRKDILSGNFNMTSIYMKEGSVLLKLKNVKFV
jgi:hypothetical protein